MCESPILLFSCWVMRLLFGVSFALCLSLQTFLLSSNSVRDRSLFWFHFVSQCAVTSSLCPFTALSTFIPPPSVRYSFDVDLRLPVPGCPGTSIHSFFHSSFHEHPPRGRHARPRQSEVVFWLSSFVSPLTFSLRRAWILVSVAYARRSPNPFVYSFIRSLAPLRSSFHHAATDSTSSIRGHHGFISLGFACRSVRG